MDMKYSGRFHPTQRRRLRTTYIKCANGKTTEVDPNFIDNKEGEIIAHNELRTCLNDLFDDYGSYEDENR